MKRYVLDSYAMIAFFEDESGADKVAEILSQIIAGRAKGFMSVINWGEMYYNTLREGGVNEAERVLEQFNKFPIQLVDADKDQTLMAAKLKAGHPIAYADCFAAALSMQLKAEIVTGDPEFKKLCADVSVIWIA